VYEVFPLLAGVTIALVMQQIASPQLRVIVLVAFSTISGATASFISGELALSWAYLPFDIAQVLLTAYATVGFTAVWRQRFPSRQNRE
jgi:hypothetical protein